MSGFEGLLIWQRAREIRILIRECTEGMGDRELKDQMRRAALSVMANIAEGSERASAADFRRFLGMAHGSCGELRSHAVAALDDGLIAVDRHRQLHARLLELSRMIAGFMKALARGS